MKIVILPLSLILSSALAFKPSPELGTGIDLADNPFGPPEKEVMPEDPEWVPDVIGFSPKPDGLAARPQCSSYWSGTAPICRGGKCRPGYHPTISSTRGGGRRCITGKKVLCECNTVTACQDYWAGKGPFCGKPKCADGYRELFKSNSGDGGLCLRGHKKYCQCISGGTIPICVPQVPIKTQCFGFLMVCNNGCKTFGCGICLGWKGAKATLESSADENLYDTLLTAENAEVRQALEVSGKGVPSEASKTAVVESALKEMEALTVEVAAIDAAASYAEWQDVSSWRTTEGETLKAPVQIVDPEASYAELTPAEK